MAPAEESKHKEKQGCAKSTAHNKLGILEYDTYISTVLAIENFEPIVHKKGDPISAKRGP